LFYLQRTINKNTIIFQLNTSENGDLIEEEPIKSFWVNYSGKGDFENLNFIQRKYAYGLEMKLLDKQKQHYSFNFVSYKKQILYLLKAGNEKKFQVFSYLNNKLVVVNRIYVHIEGGTFWAPKVKYVEVLAKDPIKGEEYTEKIII
jgi:hypothetical protein